MSSPNRIEPALLAVLAVLIALSAIAPKFLAFGVPLIGTIFFVWNGVTEKQWTPDRRIFIPFAIIGGLALLSSLWAIHPADALERAGKVAGILLGGMGLLSILLRHSHESGNPETKKLDARFHGHDVLFFSVLFLAAFMALELIFDFPFYRLLHPSKAGNAIADAVANRSIIVATLLMTPAFALAKTKWGWKKSTLIFAPIFGTLFIVTESQSAQMGMLIGLVFAFAFPYRFKAAWIALGTSIVVLIIAAPFIAPMLFQHFAQGAEAMPRIGNGSANIAPRLEIWDFVSRRALQKPIAGFGFEATRDILDFDTKQMYYENDKVLHPHNAVLQIWIEFGAVGIILAASGFMLLLRQIYKICTTAQARIALPVLMTALSVGSMSYGLWQGWWIGLLFLSTAMTMIATKAVSDDRTSL
jgi:O-antigen ligase